MWGNRYGELTGLRFAEGDGPSGLEELRTALLERIEPASLGLRFQAVREQALAASAQSMDFGQLFLGFSFFLIAAALLLMGLLFQLGLEQRATEIGTLLALGLPPRQVRRWLLMEGAGIALIGGSVGVAGGILYARAMVGALTTLWKDAVGTSALGFHMSPLTLLIGLGASVVVGTLTLWLALRRQGRRPARELLAEGADSEAMELSGVSRKRGRALWIGVASAVGALGLVGWSLAKGDQANAGAFFGAGALLLIAGLAFTSALLTRLAGAEAASRLTLRAMGVRSCARRRKRSLASVALLACGSFLVVAVGANKLDATRNATERSSGTGGFALIGEATMPVLHDLNSREGREHFGLSEALMEDVRVVPFRVRDGDDASCLNLNRAQTPRLLGVDPELMHSRGAFTFAGVAGGYSGEDGWRLLARGAGADDRVPAVGDQNSILWALRMRLGDTLEYEDARGGSFEVEIAGALANSILQGSLIVPEAEFVKRFPGESGYRTFLIDAPSNRVEEVARELSRALSAAGLELTPAAERLAAYNAVQNTYLDTFQILGGLGLLLGSAGLGVVVLRNVLERRGELALLLAVGFRRGTLRRLVLSEHAVLLWLGLGLGVLAALVAVLPALLSPGAEIPYGSLAVTLALVMFSGMVWTWLATRVALRGRLLDALRGEG
jgi:ABC-type antimicrobial peptide transport system permease subunit